MATQDRDLHTGKTIWEGNCLDNAVAESSFHTLARRRGFVAYGTAKAALSHMTRLFAHEMARRVRVNAIAVGATDALRPFLEAIPEAHAKLDADTPVQRIGRPEDIAAAALYLCSPVGGWGTGKVFEVDGGTVASNWPLELPAT